MLVNFIQIYSGTVFMANTGSVGVTRVQSCVTTKLILMNIAFCTARQIGHCMGVTL